jgi:coenzyme F420-reducing hydrogenase beta subunit
MTPLGLIECAPAATDPALRHHASSGGALSAFLRYLLDSGAVAFVA